MKFIGEKLKELRESNNLTQCELAKIAGISELEYKGYENGTRKIRSQKLALIANHYNVTLDFLIYSNDPKFIEVNSAEELILIKYHNSDEETKIIIDIILDIKPE